MIKVYAVVLALGILALITWIFLNVLAGNLRRPSLDPEERLGIRGRRVVAGAVGLGMAGMSAEYSPLDLSWPVAFVMAVTGAAGAAWYAGKVGLEPEGSA